VIERHDPRLAWHLEDSLDHGWEVLRTTGDDSYFRWVLDLIHREAESLRSPEPPRTTRLDTTPSETHPAPRGATGDVTDG
jgi:hypothetical protein